jgi:hypothetical protein
MMTVVAAVLAFEAWFGSNRVGALLASGHAQGYACIEALTMRTDVVELRVDHTGAVGREARRTLSLDATLEGSRALRVGVKKTGLLTGATLVGINIWTGAPLFALWAGSQVVPAPGLTMGAFWLIVITLAIVEFLLALLLTWLNTTYDELTGRPMEARRTSPWLRSMRGERETIRRARIRSSPIERIAMAMVVLAVLSFEAWFFFFAHPLLLQSSAGGI